MVDLSGEKRSNRTKKIIFVMLFCHLNSSMIKDTINKQTNKPHNQTMVPNVSSLKIHHHNYVLRKALTS